MASAHLCLVFGCTCSDEVVLDGSVFFLPELKENRSVYMQKRAADHGYHYHGTTPDLRHCMSPSLVRNLGKYEAKRPLLEGQMGQYLVDLEQSPERGSAGPFLPALLTHNTIVNMQTNEILMPAEHLAAQGEAIFRPGRFKSHIAESIDQLSDAELKRIAGNSFDLPTVGTWFFLLAEHVSPHILTVPCPY